MLPASPGLLLFLGSIAIQRTYMHLEYEKLLQLFRMKTSLPPLNLNWKYLPYLRFLSRVRFTGRHIKSGNIILSANLWEFVIFNYLSIYNLWWWLNCNKKYITNIPLHSSWPLMFSMYTGFNDSDEFYGTSRILKRFQEISRHFQKIIQRNF